MVAKSVGNYIVHLPFVQVLSVVVAIDPSQYPVCRFIIRADEASLPFQAPHRLSQPRWIRTLVV